MAHGELVTGMLMTSRKTTTASHLLRVQDTPCLDDFVFLDNSHVLTTDYDPDTLSPSILIHPLSHTHPRNTPAYRFSLPRLRSTLDGAEVFVRLAADSSLPTSRLGAFYTDPAPRHRALFIRLEVFALSGSNNGEDHTSTLCIPLSFFDSVLKGTQKPLGVVDNVEVSGTRTVHWHIWGPPICGMIPPAVGAPTDPGVFGCRAARIISGSSLNNSISLVKTSPENMTDPPDCELATERSGVFFEVFDFHPGRVALARAALEDSRTALENARRHVKSAGADIREEDVISVNDLDAGSWSIKTSGNLDTRIWDVSPLDIQVTEPDVQAASRLQLPYILSRRRMPAKYVLGQGGGKALLTEDALLYVPVRDFITGEPREYIAFVF